MERGVAFSTLLFAKSGPFFLGPPCRAESFGERIVDPAWESSLSIAQDKTEKRFVDVEPAIVIYEP